MAVSSKELESLWQRYTVEAVPAGISVNQFFESNGVPYHVFEKWYKKKYQSPNVVECVVKGALEVPNVNQANAKQVKETLVIKSDSPKVAEWVKRMKAYKAAQLQDMAKRGFEVCDQARRA